MNLRNKAYKHFNRVLSNVFQMSSPKRKWKEFKVQFSNASNIYFQKTLIFSPSKEDEEKAMEIFKMYSKLISGIYANLPKEVNFLDEAKTVERGMAFFRTKRRGGIVFL